MLRERPVGDARGNKWATPLRQRIQMGELLDYAHASAASSLNKGCSRALHGLTGCDRPRGEACPWRRRSSFRACPWPDRACPTLRSPPATATDGAGRPYTRRRAASVLGAASKLPAASTPSLAPGSPGGGR